MSYKTTVPWINQVLTKTEALSDRKLRTRVDVSSKMTNAIDRWAAAYESHIADRRMKLPAAIAGEHARLTTLEMTSNITAPKGNPARAALLDATYQKTLIQLRKQIEYGLAKGGLIMKPYWDGGAIRIDFVQADSFFPLAYDDSGGISSCCFLNQIRRGNRIYSRFEIHDLQGDVLHIHNIAYQTGDEENLGQEIELAEVPEWEGIAPYVPIADMDGPLYGYFKVPIANIVDSASPLGASIYSKAEDLIADAEDQYSRILWEFKGSELAIDANASYLQRNSDGKLDLPEGKRRLYREYNIDSGINEKPFFNVFSPEIRDSSLFNGLNRILQRIEFNCNLAYGTLSDVQMVDKTAEEIKSSKQRTYSAITDNQGALEDALQDLAAAMNRLASLYKLTPPGDYEISFEWDDSIIVDTATEGAIRMQEVAAGLLKPTEYIKWRYGLKTDEEALALMPTGDLIDDDPDDLDDLEE